MLPACKFELGDFSAERPSKLWNVPTMAVSAACRFRGVHAVNAGLWGHRTRLAPAQENMQSWGKVSAPWTARWRRALQGNTLPYSTIFFLCRSPPGWCSHAAEELTVRDVQVFKEVGLDEEGIDAYSVKVCGQHLHRQARPTVSCCSSKMLGALRATHAVPRLQL